MELAYENCPAIAANDTCCAQLSPILVKTNTSSPRAAVIAGSTIGALFFLCILVIATVLIIRRKQQQSGMSKTSVENLDRDKTLPSIPSGPASPDVVDPISKTDSMAFETEQSPKMTSVAMESAALSSAVPSEFGIEYIGKYSEYDSVKIRDSVVG